MSFHKDLTDLNIHTPITWTYSDALARTNAIGFNTSDLYKIARQTDDNSIWILIAITPTWVSITSGHTHVESDITDLDHNADKIKDKVVDNSAIGDGKILTFDLSSDKIIYTSPAGGGDMLSSVYDIDNNNIVDKSETLNDGSSGGGNNTTASEVRGHIDDTNNPHSVTKIQTGLGNVTDDAQLKRDAGDINSFVEKASPIDSDIIIIEDSADSNNKKKIQIGNLPKPVKEIFFAGSDYNANRGNYRARSVGSSASTRATFYIPSDFNNLVELVQIIIPNANLVNVDIDLFSDYALVGEDAQMNTESDIILLVNATANEITKIDISSVFSNIQAGHYCGIQTDNNSIGTTNYILGIILKYT